MIQTKPLTGQCPHCGAPAERLAYHSSLKGKTPALSAGLTDHRWTLRELLPFNAAITSKIT
jgi:hypothetical protein